jgi:hypothetical protein
MNGACSLLVDAASAVADTSALIWRISRSSIDGCITFSFDHGPDQMIPDFGSPQASKTSGTEHAGCDRLLALIELQ